MHEENEKSLSERLPAEIPAAAPSAQSLIDLRKRCLLGSTLFLFVVLVAGCGGSDTKTSASADVASDTAEASPPPSPAVEAKHVVQGYYRAINNRQFKKAWRLLSPAVQEANGQFDSWRDGYRYTEFTELADLDTTATESGFYEFAVQLRADAEDACGSPVHQAYSGNWTVERVNGRFLGTNLEATQIRGPELIMDSAECAPETEATPYIYEEAEEEEEPEIESEGCDPSYSGECLDPNSYDYDCSGGSGDGPDYTGTVEVVGDDHYGLDADGDGIGCEPY